MILFTGILQRAVFVGGANVEFQLVVGLLDLDLMKGKLHPDDPPHEFVTSSSYIGYEMVAIIRCRIFCLPGCYPKIGRSRYIEI